MVQLHTFSLYESKRADLSVSQPTSSTKNPNSRITNSSGGGGIIGYVLVYRYTKERNIDELRHNSMYGYENNRNSPVYRYTRTAPNYQTRTEYHWHAQ